MMVFIIIAIGLIIGLVISVSLTSQDQNENKALAMMFILMVQSKKDSISDKSLFSSLDKSAKKTLDQFSSSIAITPLSGITYDLFVDKPIDIYKKNITKQYDLNKQLRLTKWDCLKKYSFDKKKQLIIGLLEIAHTGAEPTEQVLNLLDFLRTNAFKLNQATYAKIESVYQNKRRQQNQNAQPRKA